MMRLNVEIHVGFCRAHAVQFFVTNWQFIHVFNKPAALDQDLCWTPIMMNIKEFVVI
jgi:hypothetical protein